jgi:hypothetical protein
MLSALENRDVLGAQALRASQHEFASAMMLSSDTNLPDREHPLAFVRNFGSYYCSTLRAVTV